MKLHERLFIGPELSGVNESPVVRLEYRTPGRASFVTDVQPTVGTIVAYDIGYNNEATRVFTGVIDSYQQHGNKFQIFCRELTGVLSGELPLFMRHATLRDVLNAISDRTGLGFVIPNANYTRVAAPVVPSIGSGFALLDQLGDIYSIEHYVWQQSPNGACFVGSWDDSVWASTNIPLSDKLPLSKSSSNFVKIPTIPKIRPGALVNGSRIRAVTIKQEVMELEWMS